jgi:hypothetical protein
MPQVKRKGTYGAMAPYKRRRLNTYSPTTRSYQKVQGRFRNRRTGGFVGQELKFTDDYVNGATIGSTWVGGELDPTVSGASCLNGVSQGDGETQRDGRNFMMKSIMLRGFVDTTLQESQNTPVGDSIVRLCLVMDKQTNAAQMNAEDCMDGGVPVDTISFRNLENSRRFKVLKDITLKIEGSKGAMNEGAANLFANGNVQTPFQIYHDFKRPVRVTTNGTGGTVGAITDVSLHLIGVTNAASGTNNTLYYSSRLRFYG